MNFQLFNFLVLSSSFLFSHAVVWKDTGIKLPKGISDMTVSQVVDRIVIAGGCVSGNVWVEGEYPGYYCTEISDETYEFDPDPNVKSFTKLSNLSSPRYRHSAAVWEDKLYLIGGNQFVNEGAEDYVRTVEVFDFDTNTWSSFMELEGDHLRVDHASVAYNGKIYVFGGWDMYNDYVAYNSMFAIDISTKSIVPLSPMITAKGDSAATLYEVDGRMKIVSVGGFTHTNYWCKPLDDAEIYDIEDDRWESIDSLKEARGDMSVGVLHDIVYTIGGEAKHELMCENPETVAPQSQSIAVDDVESFNGKKGLNAQWKVESDLKSYRFRSAATVWDKTQTIYLFGGQSAYSRSCDCYPASDSVFTFTDAWSFSQSVKVGIGVGIGILLLGLVIVAVIYFRKKRTKTDSHKNREPVVTTLRTNDKEMA